MVHPASYKSTKTADLSLAGLLDPNILANPYPLYDELRTSDPVHWDPYLHAWVVTRYADVVTVLHGCSAIRSPTPEQLTELGMSELNPIANVLVRQMLFRDPPAHTRLRSLAAAAFTPGRVEAMREHIREITDSLIDAFISTGHMDVIADFANLLPATVTCELMGVPTADRHRLKAWSTDFSEMLGNFQHNPGRAARMLDVVESMTSYFRNAIAEQKDHPTTGVVRALLEAEVDGDRLTEEEIIANSIITMVGGQETTTNLIGNGLLTLLRHPEEFAELRADLSALPSAVEELLRYESPIQQTARVAPDGFLLAGKPIRPKQAVISVLGAANRDPVRFPEPERLDLRRQDNRHLAFGSAAHYCFGAPLARVEAQIAFSAIIRRLPNLALASTGLVWRRNTTFRGLESLPVTFDASSARS